MRQKASAASELGGHVPGKRRQCSAHVLQNFPEDAADFYLEFFTSDPGALTGALNWYRANTGRRDPDAPEVGPVLVPTMFIWGDGDGSLCRDTALITGDFVEGPYRFEIIEGINHWVPD